MHSAAGGGAADGSWSAQDAARVLRMPTAADDKYSRGVVGIRTGSDAYPGAAVLGVEAAWRMGTGMVRYLGPDRPTALVLQRRPETVTADGRVQAWVIGSGTDAAHRPDSETSALRALLDGDVPVIVDAGAIDLAPDARAPLLLTPHVREFARLQRQLGLEGDLGASDSPAALARVAAELGQAVLLKGSRTLVAGPGGAVVFIEAGSPWLAAAGTGDVLAGVIGALVAARAVDAALRADDLVALAATGAWIHGTAGRLAAGQTTADRITADRITARDRADDPHADAVGRPIVALDVAEAVPHVIGALLRMP